MTVDKPVDRRTMDTGPAFPLFFFFFFCTVSTLIFRDNCTSTGFARIMPSFVSNTNNYRFLSFPLLLFYSPFTFAVASPFFSWNAIPRTFV